MRELISEYYLILKSLHIIFVIAWMAGLFYLPRLFVYHTKVVVGSESSELFKIMEYRLARYIMFPSMLLVFISGILLLLSPGMLMGQIGWIHGKITLVLLMAAFHGYLVREMKAFAQDQRRNAENFYRVLNEVPTILLIAIVFLVVLKPF